MYSEVLYQVCRYAIWRREPREKAREREWMRDTRGERQSDSVRNDRRHFPQSESWKAPQHADRQSSVTEDTACPAVPPALLDSLLNFYWIWNVKRREGGGLCCLIPLSVFSSPSCLPLSVRGQVCHATGAQPQTVNADKINFLMLIPVGTKHTERKSSSPVPCKTGRVSTPPFLLSQ